MHLIQIPESIIGGYTYGPRDKCYVQPQVAVAIARVCAAWYESYGSRIGIGNGSHSEPGPVDPHASHQAGLNLDIRPRRRAGEELGVTVSEKEYDWMATQNLIVLLMREGFTHIFFEDTRPAILDATKGLGIVQSLPGHHNHLHCTYRTLVS